MDWGRGMEYVGFHLRATGSDLTVVISGQTPLSSAPVSAGRPRMSNARLSFASVPPEPTRQVRKAHQ